jgi:hypothetical protein
VPRARLLTTSAHSVLAEIGVNRSKGLKVSKERDAEAARRRPGQWRQQWW